ncbi:MAG: 6-phosphogluconolactonase [Spirochaetales bacterium]|nr:6-phosphogluconolactonase [Spirochaetales bacterium]
MSININISRTSIEMGSKAASLIASLLRDAVKENGSARIILSTGQSQFEMFDALVKQDVPWNKVEMFHLDEYVNLPISHKASFRKYLNERFVSKVDLKAAYFVDGEGNVDENIAFLTKKLGERPVDVGVIGIGENGHIAFNDPPADFDATEAYRVVNLDQRCRMQQVGEGWFETVDDVPKQAISMLPGQIMKCRSIVSVVPHSVKAEAVFNTITKPVDPMVPATLLKTHSNWNLFLDDASAALLLSR